MAEIIRNRRDLFDGGDYNSHFDRVIWYYKTYQPAIFDIFEKDSAIEFRCGKNVRNIKTATWEEELDDEKENMDPSRRSNTLMIIDDFMQDLHDNEFGKWIANLFTVDSHHRNTTVFFLSQNIFHRNKYMRDISLNAHYIILMGLKRDRSQLSRLSSQIFGGAREGLDSKNQNDNAARIFYGLYNREVLRKPYSYLVINLHPSNVHRVLNTRGYFCRTATSIATRNT